MFQLYPVSTLLADATRLYTNVQQSDEAKARLADAYEYEDADYAQGLTLIEAVRTAEAERDREQGEERVAKETQDTLFARLRGRYTAHRTGARKKHRRGTPTFATLGLAGEVPDAQSAFLDAAGSFYRRIAADPTLVADVRGLRKPETIQAMQDLVQQADAARVAQDKEEAEAARATTQRDAAAAALIAHAVELGTAAQDALADRPDLLASTGLT